MAAKAKAAKSIPKRSALSFADELSHRLCLSHAELFVYIQTNSQCNLTRFVKKIAYKAKRNSLAHHCSDPTVQNSIKADPLLLDFCEQLLNDLELRSVKTTKEHDSCIWYLLQSIP